MPTRVQMTRQRPWRHEHPDAVIVARPTKWGNPYRVSGATTAADAVALFRDMVARAPLGDDGRSVVDDIRDALAGRDLACWCPLDSPCHGDVLLELANGEV